MFVQIVAFALVAFISTSEGNDVWDGLSAKFSLDGKDAFYTMPQNLQDAEREGWTEISGIDGPSDEIGLGYYGDPRIVLLFSKRTDQVVGIQVGFPVEDVKYVEGKMNYPEHPAITTKNLNGHEFFTGTARFHEDKQTGTRQIWFHENGEFHEVPTTGDRVTAETPFLLKRCTPAMGAHYYQLNRTTDCSKFFPWLLLGVEDDIIGIAFQGVGGPSSAPQRKWFEYIPAAGVTVAAPDAPDCFMEGVEEYGVVSFHLWFKKNPVNIGCSNECTGTILSTDGYEQQGYTRLRQKRALGRKKVCPV